MPRSLPPLGSQFRRVVDASVAIAEAGEIVKDGAAPGSDAYREFRPARLEALYEMSYLRLFSQWEVFLEETFVRLMCGYTVNGGQQAIAPPHTAFGTLEDARTALYSGQQYLLWHNPNAVVARSRRWFVNGIHEQIALSHLARLEWFGKVRHRIAHGSDQVKSEMDSASIQLAGKRYPGSSAGRFLRDWHPVNPLEQRRWLKILSAELSGLALQIAP